MSRDARLLNVAMPLDSATVEEDVRRLIHANGRSDCTVRLVVVRNGGGMWEGPGSKSSSDVIAMTADSKAWGESARLSIQPNARFAANEFAGAKITSWAQNLTWAERAQRQGFDETILLNERGLVAECTSANIFAAVGGNVWTPPLSDGCLAGITREVLLTEVSGQLRPEGIDIAERSLSLEDLYAADEVFMTSTTRDLMPVHEISGRSLNADSVNRLRIAERFREFVARDIASRQSASEKIAGA